ncbi:hypothetical protein MAE30S32_10800 [Microcystis aeruginosa 11-30S32]|uniref:Ice-binding protein C-terminal domain-containing protein n=2 Tax=Microcystis aeruginosa TaxID=1126 RepID=A0A510PF42_MICAE|nr:hypothetical protein MAE30S32_10800 [Microcystis aeruginosa 11-30S32]
MLSNSLDIQLTFRLGFVVPLAASVLGIGVASPGLAIPSTTPHPHGNPETPWQPPGAIPGPEHQHRDTHPLNGKAIKNGGGDVTSTVNIGGGLGFGTDAVWDNRNWRFDRARTQSLTVNPNDYANSATNYAHGFIEQGQNTAVRYRFIDSFDHDGLSPTPDINRWFDDPIGVNMRTGINNAYTAWEAAVNGLQLNVNGIPIVRSIDFMEVAADAAAEIDVRFAGIGSAGFSPTSLYLRFPYRTDYDFDDTVPIGPPPFPNDVDGNGINDNQLDFTHLSLHETGHSLGLGHFGLNRLVNLMVETAAPPLNFGVNAAGIDVGSQDGARDLYSIPVPVSKREEAKATIKSQKNPTVSFNSTTNRLSFSSGVINSADLAGGFSNSIDPLFVGDPLFGATINVTDLMYGGVTANGLHYFDPGVLTITKDNETLLEAAFDLYWLDSTLEDNNPIIDSFTILLTPTINNTIGSTLLDQLNDIAYGGEYFLDFFFQSPNADLVALTNGFTQDATVDVTYYLGPNGTPVPEPSSILGLFAIGGLGLTQLRKKRQ